jgi:hypothetical protein
MPVMVAMASSSFLISISNKYRRLAKLIQTPAEKPFRLATYQKYSIKPNGHTKHEGGFDSQRIKPSKNSLPQDTDDGDIATSQSHRSISPLRWQHDECRKDSVSFRSSSKRLSPLLILFDGIFEHFRSEIAIKPE